MKTALSYFISRFAFANGLPHLTRGVCGLTFPSPFAQPPGVGLSSPVVNAAWGCANLLLAYLLSVQVGRFDVKSLRHVGCWFTGFASSATLLAYYFGLRG